MIRGARGGARLAFGRAAQAVVPCIAKVLQAREPAEALRRRILGISRRNAQPELADIRIVRGPADLDPMMPPFVSAFLRHMLGR